MSNSTPPGLVSYCVECDAPPGACGHGAHRYLDPIAYEATESGWKVPEHERNRWEHVFHWPAPNQAHAETEPLPLGAILTGLEGIIFLSDEIRTMLHDSYELNPGQTTMLVENVKRSADTLRNPAGLLVKRLREILK